METQQAYRELGLGEPCTQDEIKARYRKLVLELHPDRSKAKTEGRLKRVTEAYHALKESSRQATAAREQHEAQSARNEMRKTPRAKGRGMAGRPGGAPPTEDWSRYTSEFEADEAFWKEYERSFWEDYEKRRAQDDGAQDDVPGDAGFSGHAEPPREEPASQKTAKTRMMPRMNVSIDKSLCIGCCSCETIAPSVFCVDKDKQVNPKSSVTDPIGASAETILDAAETCPTKAILVDDIVMNRRIYPL